MPQINLPAPGVQSINGGYGQVTLNGGGSATVTSDGANITISAPGSSGAAGTLGQVQWNDGAGDFDADSGLTYSAGTLTATKLAQTSGNISIGPNVGSGTGQISIGDSAGATSTSIYSQFIGYHAGLNATNADHSTFVGVVAGVNATNAKFSTFLGHNAGGTASNAANSIFIGKFAGLSDPVDNTVSGFSICIGPSTGTGGFSNSIVIGSSTVNTASNQIMLGDNTFRTILGGGADDGSSALQVYGDFSFDPSSSATILNVNTLTSSSTAQVNITANALVDAFNHTSINWGNRNLYDSSANTAIHWQSRLLIDNTGHFALDWQARQLLAADTFATPVLTWALNLASINGAISQVQQSTPGSPPASGSNLIYFKSNDHLYMMNSSGTESLVGTWNMSGLVLSPINAANRIVFGGATDDGSSRLQISGDSNFNGYQLTNVGDILMNHGKFMQVASGSAGDSIGTATLSGGTVTIMCPSVLGTAKIFISRVGAPVSGGTLYVNNIVAATSFDIVSTNASDASSVNWWIINS